MKTLRTASRAALCMVALGAAFLMSGCGLNYTPGGSILFDHDGDPATPTIEITQEQRCAIYDLRINSITAGGGELSSVDAARLEALTLARTVALCPVAVAERVSDPSAGAQDGTRAAATPPVI